MQEIAAHIYSHWQKEELNERLKKVDLTLVDMDDCIYPGTTNLTLLRNLSLILLQQDRYKIFFRLMTYLPVLLLMKCLQLLDLGVDNCRLILFFSRMVSNIPLSYLQTAVQPIPSNSFPGAKETLTILSRKSKIGLISLGLSIVLEEYKKQFRDGGIPLIDFYDGTQVNRLKSIDKSKRVRGRIEEFKAKMPLVIGHNRDDLGMIKVVKEQGGLVFGFNPSREVAKQCDIIVRAKDWRPLAGYLQPLLGDERKNE